MFDFTDLESINMVVAIIVTVIAIVWTGIHFYKKYKEKKRLENDSLALPRSGNQKSIESLYRESVSKGKKPSVMKKVKKVQSLEQVARKIK